VCVHGGMGEVEVTRGAPDKAEQPRRAAPVGSTKEGRNEREGRTRRRDMRGRIEKVMDEME